jgi:RNA polymerase sigma-70 factor (ECF subfamily)
VPIDPQLIERLHLRANAHRWRVSTPRFAEVLEASAQRAAGGPDQKPRDLERYLGTLHLEDLALACACADGDEGAWDYFVLEHRPSLYRAADALDPGGGARDLADSLYGELFGLRERAGERQSLFRYFHGRSSLTTWLHAVLTQRYVDRLRSHRRVEPLPDEESPEALTAPERSIDPSRSRYLALISHALEKAVAALPPRDRLRLACYYAEELTLEETGRMLGEHQATSSRQLARTRRRIRDDIERQLRADNGLTDAEVGQCFASVAEDVGPLDLRDVLRLDGERKKTALDRSR